MVNISSLRPGQPSPQQSYSRLSTQQAVPDRPTYFDQDDELDEAFNEPEGQSHPSSNADEEDEDEDDDDDHQDERHGLVSRHASASGSSKIVQADSTQAHFSRPYDFEPNSSSSRFQPPPSSPTPSLGPPSLVKLAGMGGGVQNDGVFANLSAKPDGPGTRVNTATGEMEFVGGNDDGYPTDKEEALPTYDTAALDSAPPYWETTVTLPGVNSGPYGLLGPDDVLVDGLPVGNLFGFAWNLLVSMSFQFIGKLFFSLSHLTGCDYCPLTNVLSSRFPVDLPITHNTCGQEWLSSRPRHHPDPIRFVHEDPSNRRDEWRKHRRPIAHIGVQRLIDPTSDDRSVGSIRALIYERLGRLDRTGLERLPEYALRRHA